MSILLGPEHYRILRAVRDGRMTMNNAGRYVIDCEVRPDRKTREQSVKRGMIDWCLRLNTRSASGYVLCPRGTMALAEADEQMADGVFV